MDHRTWNQRVKGVLLVLAVFFGLCAIAAYKPYLWVSVPWDAGNITAIRAVTASGTPDASDYLLYHTATDYWGFDPTGGSKVYIRGADVSENNLYTLRVDSINEHTGGRGIYSYMNTTAGGAAIYGQCEGSGQGLRGESEYGRAVWGRGQGNGSVGGYFETNGDATSYGIYVVHSGGDTAGYFGGDVIVKEELQVDYITGDGFNKPRFLDGFNAVDNAGFGEDATNYFYWNWTTNKGFVTNGYFGGGTTRKLFDCSEASGGGIVHDYFMYIDNEMNMNIGDNSHIFSDKSPSINWPFFRPGLGINFPGQLWGAASGIKLISLDTQDPSAASSNHFWIHWDDENYWRTRGEFRTDDLEVNEGVKYNGTATYSTAAHTVTTDVHVLFVDADSNDVTLTFPIQSGFTWRVKATTDPGSNTVTLKGATGSIDGSATNTTAIQLQYDSCDVYCDGTDLWLF
jgi:hypothetical protein